MPNEARIKVLLADDKNNGGSALRSVLEREPDMEVIGEAEDGVACVRLAGVLKPDVVVMALGISNRDAMEITRQIIAASPDVKVLAVALHSDSRFVVRMFHAGATGYMLKDHVFEELARAIRTLVSNRVYVGPGIAGIVKNQ
jgi:DNA-binding NarL/FixJ family response regulator